MILVVSFGTSYKRAIKAIEAIEDEIRQAFPAETVRRAFTSQVILDKLKQRDGICMDNVEQALQRVVSEGVQELTVVPTHMMDGYEYRKMEESLSCYRDKFHSIQVAKPLLSGEEDFRHVAEAIHAKLSGLEDGSTAICLMGHGTGADANVVYEKFQQFLSQAGYRDYFIGTVEALPSLDDLVSAVKATGQYRHVVLLPLMVVAGEHACHDMAGDGQDSWKSRFYAAGFEVVCRMEGLGENEQIRELYVAHAKQVHQKSS